MDFMHQLENELLDSRHNTSVTENGAVGYRTTGKNLLDLNFAVASLRGASESEIVERFKAAFLENKVLAMKWLFFARDVRGGLGERRLFRTAMKFVAGYEPGIIKSLIPLIPEYGRYDDLWGLLNNTQFYPIIMEFIKEQLCKDNKDMLANKPISLLAKWLPSANASSRITKERARIIRSGLHMSERTYRRLLSHLRSYIDVVEIKMSAKRWDEIDYETVPSRANLIYKDAFLANDKDRRMKYLSKLENGEAKINAETLYPYDIVHKYAAIKANWIGSKSFQYDPTVEALWKNLPNFVKGDNNTIVVADGSGSMQCCVGNSSVTALEVANSLAIYFAEHSSGQFKNKYITFSERPQLVDFNKCETLKDKLSVARLHNEVARTNIEAVFNLILNTAITNKLSQNEIPQNILIISDMEFNTCASYTSLPTRHNLAYKKNLFKTIEERFRTAGYKIPRLVFWNVNSRTNTIPVRENEMGVALVSGFSVNICKMVLSGKIDPFECLLETLNSERYQPIEKYLSRGKERCAN